MEQKNAHAAHESSSPNLAQRIYNNIDWIELMSISKVNMSIKYSISFLSAFIAFPSNFR